MEQAKITLDGLREKWLDNGFLTSYLQLIIFTTFIQTAGSLNLGYN